MGISPDVNKPSSRRPISIISSSSDEHERSSSIGYCNRELPDKKIVKQQQEKIVPLKFKYSRSTTVVSQCSTGKRIAAASEWDGVFIHSCRDDCACRSSFLCVGNRAMRYSIPYINIPPHQSF